MNYRVLVLPDSRRMPVEVLKKIRDLVKAGATIIGPKPDKDPGLKNYPACDAEVKTIADEVWGRGNLGTTLHKYGKGRVFTNEMPETVLLNDGVLPDFEYRGKDNYIDFIHRTVKNREIYFLTNRQGKEIKTDCLFRIGGRKPQLWDAVTGEILKSPAYSVVGGRISVSLQFAPYQSVFVVFPAKHIERSTSGKDWFYQDRSKLSVLQEIKGNWMVKFDTAWGGPESAVFSTLQDWSSHADDRIKYYSGKAVYHKTFDVGVLPAKDKTVYLDLGVVKNIATVKLNGMDQGSLWTSPWMLDITAGLKQGSNTLEIEVINLWPNRLIGDAALPMAKRLTKTNIVYKKEDKLLPSGLIGPVKIKS
jgi:hypothetical protein